MISGETQYSENLIQFAKGTDVLLHEVAATKDVSSPGAPSHPSMPYHTSPEEAAHVFEEVKPKLAVYHHMVLLPAGPTNAPPTSDDILKRTQNVYKGRVEIGEDLTMVHSYR